MPVYEYIAAVESAACDRCRRGFEISARISDAALTSCPHCGAAVRKVYSAPSIGASKSGLDDRAKSSGFHKLKRLGKGEYEKLY